MRTPVSLLALALAATLAAPATAHIDRRPADQRPACLVTTPPFAVWLTGETDTTDCDDTGAGTSEALCLCQDGTWTAVGAGGNSFETINAPSGTDPVAESSGDTLNLTSGAAALSITGDSSTDTIALDLSGTAARCARFDGSGELVPASGDCASGATGGTVLQDADADTKMQVEESADEDKVRIDTAGTERVVVDSLGLRFYSSSSRISHVGGASYDATWENSAASAAAPVFQFLKSRSGGATSASDAIGTIQWDFHDSGGSANASPGGILQGTVVDPTDTSEDTRFTFSILKAGAQVGNWIAEGNIFGVDLLSVGNPSSISGTDCIAYDSTYGNFADRDCDKALDSNEMPLNPPSAVLYNSSDFTHNSTGNYVAVTWNAEVSDAWGMHSASDNEIAFPLSGVWSCSAWGDWDSNTTGVRVVTLDFYDTPTPTRQHTARQHESTTIRTGLNQSVSSQVYGDEAGDFVWVALFQDSGANRVFCDSHAVTVGDNGFACTLVARP